MPGQHVAAVADRQRRPRSHRHRRRRKRRRLGSSLRGAIASPAFELQGCTKTQDDVARADVPAAAGQRRPACDARQLGQAGQRAVRSRGDKHGHPRAGPARASAAGPTRRRSISSSSSRRFRAPAWPGPPPGGHLPGAGRGRRRGDGVARHDPCGHHHPGRRHAGDHRSRRPRPPHPRPRPRRAARQQRRSLDGGTK